MPIPMAGGRSNDKYRLGGASGNDDIAVGRNTRLWPGGKRAQSSASRIAGESLMVSISPAFWFMSSRIVPSVSTVTLSMDLTSSDSFMSGRAFVEVAEPSTAAVVLGLSHEAVPRVYISKIGSLTASHPTLGTQAYIRSRSRGIPAKKDGGTYLAFSRNPSRAPYRIEQRGYRRRG
jgi:hypothetical protein